MWGTLVYQVRLIVRWDMWEPLGQRRRVMTYMLGEVFCSVWHNAQVETWALGMRCVAVLWGCAVGLLWS